MSLAKVRAYLPQNNLLTQADVELLKELGLSECTSLDSCNTIMDSLRMRQLDKLKMVLSRLVRETSLFTPELAQGIMKNDLKMFASAVLVLNNG